MFVCLFGLFNVSLSVLCLLVVVSTDIYLTNGVLMDFIFDY